MIEIANLYERERERKNEREGVCERKEKKRRRVSEPISYGIET